MITAIQIATSTSILFMANAIPGWCVPEQAPEINVMPTTNEVRFEYNRSSDQLSQFEISHSPYKPGTPTRVKGLHKGNIQFKTELEVSTHTNGETGKTCLNYNVINVRFHIDPTIYITNEHMPGTCEHEAIHEHEMKHLMTDRHLINEYSQKIGQAIHEDFRSYGYIWGPIDRNRSEEIFGEMRQNLINIVKPVISEMEIERQERQKAIDTIEEYERVANACR